MDGDLDRIEEWIGAFAQRLTPVARRRLAMKIGRELRRRNIQRIAANIQPDGSAMEPRKRRADSRSGRVKARGKMFRKIRLARNLRIEATPEGVAIGFASPLIGFTAAEHHFGKVGYVGKSFAGRVIRAKYPARQLLGFGSEDLAAGKQAALAHLAGED